MNFFYGLLFDVPIGKNPDISHLFERQIYLPAKLVLQTFSPS